MASASSIRILLVFEQPIFRDGLIRLLGEQPGLLVIGEAANAEHAVKLARALHPDVLLLDLAVPASLEALRSLRAASSNVRTIVFCTGSPKEVQAAMQLGARGIVLKESPTALLFKGIRAVMSADDRLPHECAAGLGAAAERSSLGGATQRLSMQAERRLNDGFRLTHRESEIVWLVTFGDTNRGIARALSIREDTVKHHLSRIFDKLGVCSRLELALFAVNHRLVRDGQHRPCVVGGDSDFSPAGDRSSGGLPGDLSSQRHDWRRESKVQSASRQLDNTG